MQFKLAFVTAALATLAVATPTPRATCSTGTLQCCNSVESASNPVVGLLAGLLDIVLGDLTAQVGLTCSPITVIGVGNTAGCSAQAVCCDDNADGGLLSLGCVPITL